MSIRKIITPAARIKKYVSDKECFVCVSDFERFVRKHGTPDYVAISNILYTMEEYDRTGRTILYANRRVGLQLQVDTPRNRYEHGFADAKVSLQQSDSWRDDLVYAD